MMSVRTHATAALIAAAGALAGAAGAQEADPATLDFGRRVFTEIAEPGCPICHTLADAGAVGEVGPSLDAMRPDAARVAKAVTDGVGPMLPYEALDAEQIEALAAYVAAVAGQ
jgi:mono/diheme cytochrome c family protein